MQFPLISKAYDEALWKLCARAGLRNTKWVKEIYRRLVTQEEAEMLLNLPATVDEFAEKNGVSAEYAQRKIDEFVLKGVAIKYEHDDYTIYRNPSYYMQLHDSTGFPLMYGRYIPNKEQKEIPTLWQYWRETESYVEVWRNAQPGKMRVAPYPHTLENPADLIPQEDYRELLNLTKDIVVNKCWCRFAGYERGGDNLPIEVCLHFDYTFENDYLVKNDMGRRIDKDEALRLAEGGMDAGLVLLPSGGGLIVNNMCMCDTNYCVLNRQVAQYDYPVVQPSRYLAVVDEEKCNACGTCVKACRFYAMEMTEASNAELSKKPLISEKKCMGCGVCAHKCPQKALALRLVRPEDHILMDGGPFRGPFTEVENFWYHESWEGRRG